MFRTLLAHTLGQVSSRLPSRCAVCAEWPVPLPVCEDCVTEFAQPEPRCTTCALPVVGGVTHCGACVLAASPLDRCVTGVGYHYPWSQLVMDFKFGDQPAWAEFFTHLMHTMPDVDTALDEADLLLPVPLHPNRMRERGYNQALELALALGPQKTRSHILLRIQDTPVQSMQSLDARVAQMRGAFAVDPLLANTLRGKNILLIDDVMTSGATLFAAARTVRAAGAAKVSALVFARTDLD